MPDTEYAPTGHDRAHTAVRRLRARLAELGFLEDQIRQVVPVSDINRRMYVRLGTITVESAEVLLAALEPGQATSAP